MSRSRKKARVASQFNVHKRAIYRCKGLGLQNIEHVSIYFDILKLDSNLGLFSN